MVEMGGSVGTGVALGVGVTVGVGVGKNRDKLGSADPEESSCWL